MKHPCALAISCVAVLVARSPLNAQSARVVDPGHRVALEARILALRTLDVRSTNSNERGWLAAGIREAEARLK